jgi:hypothetical protein
MCVLSSDGKRKLNGVQMKSFPGRINEQSESTQHSEQYFPSGGPPQQRLVFEKRLVLHWLGTEHSDPGVPALGWNVK